eukprot:COSAG02_NODE_1239_length_13713_cov_37.434259_17_plen_349_part_00
MLTGTAQQVRRGSRQHHGPAAGELVKALMSQALIREFLQDGKRKPSTLSALERRWFVGRLRLATALEKYNSLSKAELSDPLLGGNLELLGTAGLLRMASSADSNKLVTVRASEWAEWFEFLLHVPVRKRGKLPVIKRAVAGKPWARGQHDEVMGIKKYYVHAKVVAAANKYIHAFEKREHMKSSPPTSFCYGPPTSTFSPRTSGTRDTSVDCCTSTELALAPAVFERGRAVDYRALNTTATWQLEQPATIDDFMHLQNPDNDGSISDPGEIYTEPEVAAPEHFIAEGGDTSTLSRLQNFAANYNPFPLEDDLLWLSDGEALPQKSAEAVATSAGEKYQMESECETPRS